MFRDLKNATAIMKQFGVNGTLPEKDANDPRSILHLSV